MPGNSPRHSLIHKENIMVDVKQIITAYDTVKDEINPSEYAQLNEQVITALMNEKVVHEDILLENVKKYANNIKDKNMYLQFMKDFTKQSVDLGNNIIDHYLLRNAEEAQDLIKLCMEKKD
jgi:phosphoenolpyruvate carboxylase